VAGVDADLVMLSADPAGDVKAFAGVQLVVRHGRIVYDARARRRTVLIRLTPNSAIQTATLRRQDVLFRHEDTEGAQISRRHQGSPCIFVYSVPPW